MTTRSADPAASQDRRSPRPPHPPRPAGSPRHRAGARTSPAPAPPGTGAWGQGRTPPRAAHPHRHRMQRPRAVAKRSASSACGPPRIGTRIRPTSLMPRCFTTAMSDGASRTTSSMVALKTGPSPSSRRPGGRPPQPKMTRSASSSVAISTMPSAARRPMRTTVRRSTPSGRELQDPLQQPPRLARPGRPLRQWHAFRHLHDGQRGDHATVRQQRRADTHQVRRRPRVGKRDEDACRQCSPTTHVRPPRLTRPPATGRRTPAWPARTPAPGAPRPSPPAGWSSRASR